MPAPFYPLIKGTTAGTPGTGAFTPNAAASGFRAWSTVPRWTGLVRYDDGSAWELGWAVWNGTTLSRSSTQFFDSSTGSPLSLTSSATAAMVVDPNEVMPDLGSCQWRGWVPTLAGTAWANVGMSAAPATTGTLASAAIAATNYLTEQVRIQNTSATTANAQAVMVGNTGAVAVVSTSAGRGGFVSTARWGASVLPTGPRLFVGMTSATFVGNTGEPSALVAKVAAFAKDSGDTNIQLLTNDGTGGGTKIDTGIAWAANGWYESSIWCEPGSNKVNALLMRMDPGNEAVWFQSTTTDVPIDGSLLFPQMMGGLNGTNTGTAIVFHGGSLFIRTGQ